MNYKYKVYAASKLGDVDTNPNEYYYADGLSSVENGMCSSWSYINRECMGRKHIFAISSELSSDSAEIPEDGKTTFSTDFLSLSYRYILTSPNPAAYTFAPSIYNTDKSDSSFPSH